jgi:hypothetical protein
VHEQQVLKRLQARTHFSKDTLKMLRAGGSYLSALGRAPLKAAALLHKQKKSRQRTNTSVIAVLT